VHVCILARFVRDQARTLIAARAALRCASCSEIQLDSRREPLWYTTAHGGTYALVTRDRNNHNSCG
jgi:hypothetical protein